MEFSFQPKGKHPPMTAAERQRRCRARGKGRHRGYRPTRAQLQALLGRAETPALEPVTIAAVASPSASPSSTSFSIATSSESSCNQ